MAQSKPNYLKGSCDMPQTTTVENAQKHIKRVEGFRVHILHPYGRDVNENRAGIPRYGSKNAAPDKFTVTKWKSSRFCPKYSGFKVDVLMRNGGVAKGNTRLGTVRRSYLT
jgi:hypothetical protein